MKKQFKLPLSPREFEALCDLRLAMDFHRGRSTSLLETLLICKKLTTAHYSEVGTEEGLTDHHRAT